MEITFQFNFQSPSLHLSHHTHQAGRLGQAFTKWRKKSALKPGSKRSQTGLDCQGRIPFSTFSIWVSHCFSPEKKQQ